MTEHQPTPRDLEQALGQAGEGDSDAFARLHAGYVDRIFRSIRLRVGDDREREDLTELVFLRAWQAIGRYHHQGRPFTAWLSAIAANVVADHFRSRGALTALDPNLVDRSTSSDPVAASEARTRRASLKAAIRRLTPDQQQVVFLRFVEGLSPAEVAAAIGKREGTVRVIQHRALAALRSMLAGEGSREPLRRAVRRHL